MCRQHYHRSSVCIFRWKCERCDNTCSLCPLVHAHAVQWVVVPAVALSPHTLIACQVSRNCKNTPVDSFTELTAVVRYFHGKLDAPLPRLHHMVLTDLRIQSTPLTTLGDLKLPSSLVILSIKNNQQLTGTLPPFGPHLEEL